MKLLEKSNNTKLDNQNTETLAREKEIYTGISNVKAELVSVEQLLESNKVKGEVKLGMMLKKLK